MISLLVAALVQTAAPTVQPCLKDGGVLEGEFRYVESRHPNGTNLRYGFVVTPEPVCIAATFSDDPSEKIWGRWIQISWSDEQIGNVPYPGDSVSVSVGDCFEPHTAWHLGDIICVKSRLISREPM